MLKYWVWFAHRGGIGERAKYALLQQFQDPEKIYFADAEAYRCTGLLSQAGIQALQDKDLSEAERILRLCSREKIRILTIRDGAYPSRLRNISDPPVLLYYKGKLPYFDEYPTVGIVGTRKASLYGLNSAKRLGYQIGRGGGIVVSGMAAGIDTVAMQGALMAEQTVVGVLGCGADVVYPPSNGRLFADVEQYGCILSEYPPGTAPLGRHFPRRNRIISGLSCGVLVVEAPERSGALITAEQAAEQGRDLFVVPGPIDNPSCAGSNGLLRNGGIAVTNGWDVLGEYTGLFPDKLSREEGQRQPPAWEETALPAEPGETPEKASGAAAAAATEKKSIDKPAARPYIDLKDSLKKLSAEERAIVEALQSGERLTDDVIAQTGLSTGRVLAAMTMLELKGLLRRLPGKRISLK